MLDPTRDTLSPLHAVLPLAGPLQRAALVLALLFLLPTCGGSSGSAPAATPVPPIEVGLQVVASGLPPALHLTHAGDGSGRKFIVLQTGQILILDAADALLATPFLDISALLVTLATDFDERGLLGLAFHPQFATNGRFFVRYSTPRTGAMGEPCFGSPRGCHTSVLSEFGVTGNPTTNNVADPTSERVLFTVSQPQFNHNAGGIAFGPDGFLYFSLGDGGGSNDGLADMPPSHGPIGHGQDTTTPLGAILRIDVDTAPPMGSEYVVPASNPFVGVAGLDEIYAYGLRNPYRFSFDDRPGGTNKLLCGDVGQGLFEELDDIVLGGNYGWAVREGFACFDPFNNNQSPPTCPSIGAAGEPLLNPVLDYGRGVGVSIIAGHVYRGQGVPALSGVYVFGDWASDFSNPNGRMFVCDIAGPNAWVRRDLVLQPGAQPLGGALMGIGEDEAGEVYALTIGSISPLATTGRVLRIVPAP